MQGAECRPRHVQGAVERERFPLGGLAVLLFQVNGVGNDDGHVAGLVLPGIGQELAELLPVIDLVQVSGLAIVIYHRGGHGLGPVFDKGRDKRLAAVAAQRGGNHQMLAGLQPVMGHVGGVVLLKIVGGIESKALGGELHFKDHVRLSILPIIVRGHDRRKDRRRRIVLQFADARKRGYLLHAGVAVAEDACLDVIELREVFLLYAFSGLQLDGHERAPVLQVQRNLLIIGSIPSFGHESQAPVVPVPLLGSAVVDGLFLITRHAQDAAKALQAVLQEKLLPGALVSVQDFRAGIGPEAIGLHVVGPVKRSGAQRPGISFPVHLHREGIPVRERLVSVVRLGEDSVGHIGRKEHGFPGADVTVREGKSLLPLTGQQGEGHAH